MSEIRLRLREILEERNIPQKEIIEQTGIRPGTLSALVRGTNERVSLPHLAIVMDYLKIDDISEVLTIKKTPTE